MSRNQRRNRRNKSGGGSTANPNRTANDVPDEKSTAGPVRLRASTETKSSLKTTELVAYAGAVLGVVMTALALDADGQGGDDPFGAEAAIRYITYLTIGYMVARGLAKSGSHENRVERDTSLDADVAPRTVMVDDEEGRDDVDALDSAPDHRPDRPAVRVDRTDEIAEPDAVPADDVRTSSGDEIGARS